MAKPSKESRFGLFGGQKMAYFVCTFERQVNGVFLPLRPQALAAGLAKAADTVMDGFIFAFGP